ncbi:MAG: dTDP-4-dehydrorhamnose reductase [Terriglobales bacterium]
MRILLIGAQGQLGRDLFATAQAAGHEVVPHSHAQLDIRDAAAVESQIAGLGPDAVISTAAFHQVELCERQPEEAFATNAFGVLNLARACQRHGAALMHFSTDYVFDGQQRTPYFESDRPRPLNAYGMSKLAGEYLLAANCERHFIVRTTGLYGLAGSAGKGGNFVETMLKKAAAGEAIRVVQDQVLTPTYTVDLAHRVVELLVIQRFGLYHMTNEGQCSWHEFTAKIFALAGLRPDLQPVDSATFASPVRRPAFSVLAKGGLRAVGLAPMPPWQDALERYLRGRAAPARQ